MILSQSIGDYSQTIRIGQNTNHVEVKRQGVELFNGEAIHIVDKRDTLSFKDPEGKQYDFVKYHVYTYS
jgi:hypothetical protein